MDNSYYYFLNRKDNAKGFAEMTRGKFFVDKSMLIDIINSRISTKEKWFCVSRPRRFGKTSALEMLAAYYTKGLQTDELFRDLKIRHTADYNRHLNAHHVIYMNFSDFFENETVMEGICQISERLLSDLKQVYPDGLQSVEDVLLALDMTGQMYGDSFVFLIDEWDCVFRFHKGEYEEQALFLLFLKRLLKDKPYVELVYMTGILPVKKYNTGSALNMFREYTMIDPKKLAPFFGFTGEEVKGLCKKENTVPFEKLREWYNGYSLDGTGGIYNPRSVVEALEEGTCGDYWSRTGGFSELEEYITMNFSGLGETVTRLLAGEEEELNVVGFSNDLDSFQDKDEVLTALVHLGYLTCSRGKVRIPNREIREEFANTIKKLSWGVVSALLHQSRELLTALLEKKADKVAGMLEDVHDGMQEFKEYNNEHTLKCVIHLAFYASADDYDLKYETPAGKGLADCIFFPRRPGLPGIILELKYGGSVREALDQIKSRGYLKAFKADTGRILLVGINYDRASKRHQCMIEECMR